MVGYFKNYSSNAHQVCCEDSPPKRSHTTITNPMTTTFIQGHTCISNLTTFNLQYIGQYLSYYIQSWHGGRLMHGLELDLDFKIVCKASPTCLYFGGRVGDCALLFC